MDNKVSINIRCPDSRARSVSNTAMGIRDHDEQPIGTGKYYVINNRKYFCPTGFVVGVKYITNQITGPRPPYQLFESLGVSSFTIEHEETFARVACDNDPQHPESA